MSEFSCIEWWNSSPGITWRAFVKYIKTPLAINEDGTMAFHPVRPSGLDPEIESSVIGIMYGYLKAKMRFNNQGFDVYRHSREIIVTNLDLDTIIAVLIEDFNIKVILILPRDQYKDELECLNFIVGSIVIANTHHSMWL